MRVILFISFLLLTTTNVQAQAKSELETSFNSYLELILANDFETAFDYAPSKLFEIVPRDLMVTAMNQVFNNPDMKIYLSDPSILDITDKIEIEGAPYYIITYASTMNMEFNDLPQDSSVNAILGMAEIGLASDFGKENVARNEANTGFKIYSVKKVCALIEDGGFKFVAIELDQLNLLRQLIPNEIIKMSLDE